MILVVLQLIGAFVLACVLAVFILIAAALIGESYLRWRDRKGSK